MIPELKAYPAMKDSGVSWLGEVPKHWEVVALRHRYSQVLGKMLDSKRVTGSHSLSYLRNTDVQWDRINVDGLPIMDIPDSEYDRYTVQTGDLLVCEGGEVGRCAIWAGELAVCGFQKALHRLRPRSAGRDVPRFLYYALRSAGKTDAFNDGHVSTIPHLTGDKLRAHRFPFPPLPEQTAIVRFLDHADRLIRRYIRAKQKLIKLLEEQKQAIIHRAVTRGLDPNVCLTPSGVEWLGDVPEHWEVRRAKKLFRELDRRSVTGAEVLLSLRMYQGLVPHNEVSTITINADALVGFKKVEPGQVVMNRMRAAIGMFAIADRPGLVSPDYAVLEPIVDLDAQYFVRLFKTPAAGRVFRIESKGLGTGSSGFMRLYTDRFGLIKLPVPPDAEQRQIVRSIADSTAEIDCTQKRVKREISLLHEYRTRLIFDVVTGKLDVRATPARLRDESEEADPLDETDMLRNTEDDVPEDIQTAVEEAEA